MLEPFALGSDHILRVRQGVRFRWRDTDLAAACSSLERPLEPL
jgi:hypothetical protein